MSEMDTSEQTTIGMLLSNNLSGKRNHTQIASPNAIQDATSKQSKQKIDGDPAPIVYFDIESSIRNNEKITLLLKQANIYDPIRNFRLTNNGNLIIFPKSLIRKSLILECEQFLPGITKLDLAVEDKGPMIIIKGSPHSVISKSHEELETYGISETYQISNTKNGNKELKLVKALVPNEDDKEELLNQKFIYIYKIKHYIEDVVKQPTQCINCKNFGTLVTKASCKCEWTCSRCAKQHDPNQECSNAPIKCVNCNRSHSSYYRGCKVYQTLKLELNKSKANSKEVYEKYGARTQSAVSGSQSLAMPEASQVNYSSMASKNDILDKIDKLAESQNKNFEKQTSKIEDFKSEIQDIKSSIVGIESTLKGLMRKQIKRLLITIDLCLVLFSNYSN